MEDGTIINKALIENMILSKGEVSSLFKLSTKHLNPTEIEKQNVKLAAELMSHTTATAVKRYFPNVEGESLGNFIDLINDWFDIMNSRNMNETIPYKRPYNGNLAQITRLNEMRNAMTTLRCCGKKALQIFQKANILSINSFKGLFEDMQNQHRIKFLLANKLNQDALENLFSQVRNRGGMDDHPTPLQFLNRLRMIIVGRNPGVLRDKTNILNEQPSENEIVSMVCQRCDLTNPVTENLETFDILSSSPSTSTISLGSSPEDEEDGLTYLSGWLAKKFQTSYPDLGNFTYVTSTESHETEKVTWIQALSYGGLTEPSKKLHTAISFLENKFKRLNKKSFAVRKSILKRLFFTLKNKVDLPEDVTKAFIKQRIMIRIKHLNKKIVHKRDLKNKGKSKSFQKIKRLSK